jgi:signal transduction histidine kinase
MLAAGHFGGAEAASRIRKSASRMIGIIDDLLALSVAGRPTPGEAPVAQVVDEVLGELAPDLADAKVEVRVDDVRAACSPGVLAQLLRNLVSNAIKYRSPVRPLALDIAAGQRDGAVELAVKDNGVGMSPEAVAHAFEPFFRAAQGRAPGHGLGLAIVERTVSALGGECELESHVDQGTRVALRLPIAGGRRAANA